MKKVLIIMLGISGVLLLLWGCSHDSPTSPANQPDQDVALRPMLKDVMIGFKGAPPKSAVSAVGGTVKREYRHIPVINVSLPATAIEGLSNNPNILFIEDNKLRFTTEQELDWGVNRIDAEYVFANSSYDGSGINVAILDTGGDMDHEDLTWAGGVSIIGKNPNSWDDKDGHGTHCAGIVGADDNTVGVIGAAHNCGLWAVKIGRSGSYYVSDIVAGIDWCIATRHDGDPNNDIHIMNMSYGGGYAEAEDIACQNAYDDGMLMFAAAGNDYGGDVDYPGALSSVMAISASDSTDALADFSDQGPEVELIAPGDWILSTYKGGWYAWMSGTSMSAPMAAGAAALAWSAHPSYSNVQIRNLINNSAQDIGLSSDQQGSGLVDAETATLGTTNGDDLGGGGPVVGDTMHVAAIDFSVSKNGKFLYAYVTVHSDDHVTPVEGATVEMTLDLQGGGTDYYSGSTGADGAVRFTKRSIASGQCYTATVTDVSLGGWTYDPAANEETTDSYCIP
jgi:subtilisin family serine protease